MSSFDDGTSKCKGVSAEHQAGLGVCRATQHFDDGTSKHKEMLLFHCFTACYVFNKEETLAFSAKNLQSFEE